MKLYCYFLFLSSLPLFSEKINFWKSIELVQKGNPILVARRYDMDIAKTDIKTASMYPNPIFNTQILSKGRADSTSGNPLSLPTGGGNINPLNSANRQDWFQITQTLPVASQIELSILLAKRRLQLTQDSVLEFERNLLLLVQSKWIDAWFYQEKFKTLEKGRKYLDDLVQTNKLRYKNQVITKTELDRTKIIFDQYSIEMNTQKQYTINSLNSLKFLYGLDKEIELDSSNFFNENDLNKSIENLTEYALKNRSDIKFAKSAQDASLANLKLQEANAYPRPDAGIIYNPQNNDPYFGFIATVPIPINNRNQGQIEKAKFEVDQSLKEFDAKEAFIKVEIQNAYREFILFKENFEKYQEIVTEADSIRNVVQYSYLKGGTNVVDYLEVQRNWLQTQIALLDTQSQYRRAYLQLLYATGRIHGK